MTELNISHIYKVDNENDEKREVNIYNISDIINNRESWLYKKDPFITGNNTKYSLANILYNHLLSIVCNEPKSVLKQENLMMMYFNNAKECVYNGVDNALLPDNFIQEMSHINNNNKEEVLSLVKDMIDIGDYNFNKIYKLKIISTTTKISFDVDNNPIMVNVPIVTESKNGIVAIIPVMTHDINMFSSILSNCDNAYGIKVSSIMIWDFMNKKKLYASGEYPDILI